MDQEVYWEKGLQRVRTQSSVLVSSSKYLNESRLRDWMASESLRRNGRDYPFLFDLPRLLDGLDQATDVDRINALFKLERSRWPELDRWFEESFVSRYTREDLKLYPKTSAGGMLSRYLEANDFQIELNPRIEQNPDWKPSNDWEYWTLRTGQTHDLDHIIGGVGFDFLGEALPPQMRIQSYFKFFGPELAAELSKLQMFISWPWGMRTMLHYPECWQALWSNMERGAKIGRDSGPFFLARYEPLLHLTPAELREMLDVRGVEEVDTTALSDVWSEGAQSAQLVHRD